LIPSRLQRCQLIAKSIEPFGSQEDKVKQAAKIIAANPRKLDSEIAAQVGFSRHAVNEIRLLMSRAPKLWDRVQSGDLSVWAAANLRRNKPPDRQLINNAVTVEISLETLSDLRAFLALGREVFERLEKELRK
jgi:hypothetical protein